jgi:arylsulfatase A-like enzyme
VEGTGKTRREFIKGASTVTAALAGVLHAGRQAAARHGGGDGPFSSRPNFLIIMTDEERFPPRYETDEIRAWRRASLPARELLREHGLEFRRHYTASTACTASRTTFYTGHYPSLHGVSQTDGAAKSAADPTIFWLDPNTVPTMGNYFRAAGYKTFYKGKWHVSETDILVPGTKTALSSYTEDGTRDPAKERAYLDANRLSAYGFNGWIGPNPHGADARNSGSSSASGPAGRDLAYADQTVELLDRLDRQGPSERPWVTVCSFVNPHDITLYGFFTANSRNYDFTVDAGTPQVPPSPTDGQSLAQKPICQASYRRTYGQAFQPTFSSETYRRLYYQFHRDVDEQMLRVLQRLQAAHFYEDTIVIFTSDHGELLGSHGGLFQKWHCAYEEVIHVPLIVHNPRLFPRPQSTRMLTSHVDILPTMLGLAGADEDALRAALRDTHTDVVPLVGRNLAALITGEGAVPRADEPIYFMTDDEPTSGPDQQNFTGFTYNAVRNPNHVETIVARLQTPQGFVLWKYSRYFDNPQFWTDPCNSDEVFPEIGDEDSACQSVTRRNQLPDQLEMYNLTADPYEKKNLAFPTNRTPESEQVRAVLAGLLAEQREQKRLYPASGGLQGIPACTLS